MNWFGMLNSPMATFLLHVHAEYLHLLFILFFHTYVYLHVFYTYFIGDFGSLCFVSAQETWHNKKNGYSGKQEHDDSKFSSPNQRNNLIKT